MHCNTEKTTQTKINKGRENGGKFLYAYPWPSPLRPLFCIVHLGLRQEVDEMTTLDQDRSTVCRFQLKVYIFLKEVSFALQGCIHLNKNTVKTVIFDL